ncbi:hypothetical protein Moror_1104 [Moniliophthora roreri MCA 2997]|uniref:Uncharacterized protein n=2 Tax=Moniliophthora roreri TaxID=221103 RepID=V2X248_MONRO|nr:hypothetical protein Moror_1104 [Moniliophthora roreri MCA 2997]KAI3598507.1 hypothetical protein WG66_017134 [Moniliophthora roreri]
MATYTLNVFIDTNQLQLMKDLGYNLCVAKLFNDSYTVVWKGDMKYLQNNRFQWKDEYEVFASNSYTVGLLVEAVSNAERIKFGQKCILDASGVMGSAGGTPNDSGNFRVDNEYGSIHIGVNAKLGNQFLPIFNSPTEVVGTAYLTPVNTVKVWFSQEYQTGSMIFQENESGIEVDMTGKTVATIEYKGSNGMGKWTVRN